MTNTINFGIDLGTTNSLLAFSGSNGIEIFKNPVGHRETLPSVVAFKPGRTIVGEKAREMIGKDPTNVFHSFKRKMGTGQKYFADNTGEFVSPIELSALVLKELKNFNYSGQVLDAAVITIPASFDTLQSNATKEAGYAAGINEVILLQEPIAASLAFANKIADQDKLKGKWMVYDLGGGTFDVALIEIGEEMRVLDHRGDNYMGGLDFDNLIIEKLVVPYLEIKYNVNNLFTQMRSGGNAYNKLYYILLHKAEELKKELSVADSAELEFDFIDADNNNTYEYLVIKRSDFEAILLPKINQTVTLVEDLLQKNNLQVQDIKQLVLVGGSTYIPLVKQTLQERTGIAVNNSIDPTTAIAVGAAYFASGKVKTAVTPIATETSTMSATATKPAFSVRESYNKNSNDTDEVLVALVEGETNGFFYRITRDDGGFDSGLLPLKNKVTAVLALLQKSVNRFKFEILDAHNNPVYRLPHFIEINQGTYSVYGQTLPNDICLEVDNINSKNTKLEAVFAKNNLLPLKKTMIKTLSKTLTKGSTDSVIINVFEGSRFSRPASCIPLGHLLIKGDKLSADIYRGSDIELVFEISESRDIKVQAYCISSQQEFSDIFKPTERKIDQQRLREELREMRIHSNQALDWALAKQDFEAAAKNKTYVEELINLEADLEHLPANDITDTLYQIEERKRFYSQTFDTQQEQDSITNFKEYYLNYKNGSSELITERGNTKQKQQFEKIVADEVNILASNSIYAIQAVLNDIGRIVREIRQNDPDYILSTFENLRLFTPDCFKDYTKAQQYFQRGEKAFLDKSYIELKALNNAITVQLKDEYLINDDYSNTGLK